MGLCPSKETKQQQEERRINNLLTDGIEPDKKDNELKVKLLLLGAGDSGKSTLFKQMRINYTDDYNKKDLQQESSRIINAFLESFAELIKTVLNHHSTMGSTELDNAVDEILDPNGRVKKIALNAHTVKLIKMLWSCELASKTWDSRSRYQLVDSLNYFCEEIDRLASDNYLPTEKDYLLCRIRSTGIIEQTFTYNKVKFQIVDVGGQRSERRKWVQCFDNVTSVIFVAAISEFDQKLFEDNHVDRIQEALSLFQKTLNFKVFKTTPIILFLNKLDLFEQKLKHIMENGEDLNTYWPTLNLGKNYDGAQTAVMNHYRNMFEELGQGSGKIFAHFVTATDKNNFNKVFKATAHIILTRTIDQHFST